MCFKGTDFVATVFLFIFNTWKHMSTLVYISDDIYFSYEVSHQNNICSRSGSNQLLKVANYIDLHFKKKYSQQFKAYSSELPAATQTERDDSNGRRVV